MSSNIDERIVQMEFNNGQFERGIKQSTDSLEQFQEKLQFKEATKGMKELERASSAFSLDGIAKSVYAIENTFTDVFSRIKYRVIDKLADDIYDFGKKYMKMFTVDQLSSGWGKYADKTQAVQTIIAATGKDIDYVNERLQKLNWFTDETSYNFVDMAANIGKFTANKVDLDDAVTAMEGIATLASLSGQGVSEASRAMYNFAQALGVGSVKLMDWRSIENANMATAEFKETIIATAKKLGKLTAAGKTLKGAQVTVENFSSTLSEGWFDKDVLMESLRLYGEYADAVYEASEHGLIPAAQAMKTVSDAEMKLGAKAFRAAQEAKTLNEAINATTDAVSSGWMNTFEIIFGNYEQQKVLWTDLANALWEVFASGAEARNELLKAWADADVGGRKDALEAVYSILESIWVVATNVGEAFRDMLPEITVDTLTSATIKLTEFADNLKSTFSAVEHSIMAPVKEAAQTLPIMEKFDGALKMGSKGEGVKALQKHLLQLGYDVGEKAVDGIWGPDTERAFRKFQEEMGRTVDGIYDKGDHLALLTALTKVEKPFELEEIGVVTEYSERLMQLRNIFSGLGAVVNILRGALSFLWNTMSALGSAVLGPVADLFLTIGSNLGLALVNFDAWISDSEIFEGWFESVKAWIDPFAESMETAKNAILDFFGFGEKAEGANQEMVTFQSIWENVKTSMEESGVLDKITSSWENFKATLNSIKETIIGYWETVRTYLADKFNGTVESAGEWLPSIMTTLGNGLASALEFINGILEKIPGSIDSIVGFFSGLYESVANSEIVKTAGENLSTAFKSIKKAFEESLPKIKEYWEQAKAWLGEKFGGMFESAESKLPNIIAAIGNGLAVAFNFIANAISKLPENIGKIKSFFIDLYEKLSTSEKLKGIVEKLKKIFETVKKTLSDLWDSIVSFFTGGGKKKRTARKRTQTGEMYEFEETTEEVSEKVDWLDKIWTGIKHVAKVIFETILSAVSAIGEGISAIWKAIPTWAKWAIAIIGPIVLLGVFVMKLVRSGKGLLDSLTQFKYGYEKTERPENIAKKMLEFAAAVALIAAAIYVLGSMDSGKLKQGGITTGVIIFVLAGITALCWAFSKTPTGALGSQGVASTFKAIEQLAIGIGILAAVVVVLGVIPKNVLIKGGVCLVLLGAFVLALAWLASRILSRNPAFANVQIALKGLSGLAIAIGILALVVMLIGKNMEKDEIIKGLIVVGVLTVLVGAIAVLVSKSSLTGNVKLKGFIGLAAAIAVMALVVYKLGKMKEPEITQGIQVLTQISVLVGALMLISALVGKTSSKTGVAELAVLFLGLDSLIYVLGYTLEKIKDVDPAVIKAFAESMAVAVGSLVLLSAASAAANKFSTVGGMAKGAAGIGTAFAVLTGIVTAVLVGLAGINEGIAAVSDGRTDLINLVKEGGEVLQAISSALTPLLDDWKVASVAAGAIVGSIAVGSIPGGFVAAITGAAGIGGAFSVLVGIITAVLSILGMIEQCAEEHGVADGKGLSGLIDKAGEILTSIGTALGGFVGSFISGIVTPITEQADNFSASLAKLTTAVGTMGSPDEIKTDVQTAIEVFTQLDTYFKTIKPYKLLNSTNLQGYATAPAQLSTDITAFSTGLATLRPAVEGLNNRKEEVEADITEAIAAAELVKSFFDQLKPYQVYGNAFKGYFTAPKQLSTDLQTFGDALTAFRTGINGAANSNTIPDTSVALAAAGMVKGFFDEIQLDNETLADQAGVILEYSRRVDFMIEDIGSFGTTMGAFGTALTSGNWDSETIISATTNAISAANSVAGFLVGLNDPGVTIETNKGVFDRFFTGDTKQDTVFDNIETLGTKVGSAVKALQSYTQADIGKVDTALDIITKLVGLVSFMSKEGLTSWDVAPITLLIDDIGLLGDSMGNLHRGMQSFTYDTFSGDYLELREAFESLSAFKQIAVEAKNIGDTTDAFTNYYVLIASISDIATNISGLSDKKIGKGAVDNFVSTAEGLNTIASALSNLGSLSAESINSAVSAIQSAITGADWSVDTDAITQSISSSIDQSVLEALGGDLLQFISNGLIDNLTLSDALLSAVSNSAAMTKSSANYSRFTDIGKYFDQGLASGIKSNSGTVAAAVRSLIENNIIDTAMKALDAHSPSKKGIELGMYFDQGIMHGLYDYSDDVTRASKQVMADLIGSAADTVSVITQMINEDVDSQPVIRPVLDLSDISTNAQRMNGLFGNRTIGLSGGELAAKVQTNANAIPVGSKVTSNVNDAINSLNDRLDNLGESMTHLKVVMDSGVVAGEISPYVDKNLGRVIQRRGRG